jgi:hypothetical protein
MFKEISVLTPVFESTMKFYMYAIVHDSLFLCALHLGISLGCAI